MAVLTKEQPRPVNTWKKNSYCANKHYERRQPQSSSLLKKPEEVNYIKKRISHPNNDDDFEQDRKVPLMKYDEKINTSYTPLTLIVHVLIICQHIYTLGVTLTMPASKMRLASFTQLVYLTTTCFHIATLLANVFKKTKLERAFVLYGTWVIWIGWAMCLWLIRPELYKLNANGGYISHYYNNRNDSPMHELEYLLAPTILTQGKWSTTTMPIISFFLLLVIRRKHWGLITWEYLVLLDYSRTFIYRTWCVAGTGAGWMLTWEAAKFWLRIPFSEGDNDNILYRTDLPTYPGLFNVLCVSSLAGMFMVCWWSFWTFQYRGVIWKKEFKEGIAVWSSDDGWMRVGGIGC